MNNVKLKGGITGRQALNKAHQWLDVSYNSRCAGGRGKPFTSKETIT